MIRRKPVIRASQTLNPFPPFIDIVVATLMILLLVIAVHTLQSMRADVYEEIDTRQTRLRQAVASAFPERWGQTIRDHVDGEEQLFRFSDEILFPTAKAKLYPEGISILQGFGAILKERKAEFAAIRVEGHSDERPIYYPFPSNWELSTARATAVVRVLTDPKYGVSLDPRIVTAAGYAEHHPIAQGHNEAAWRLNRRIEIAVRCSPDAVIAELRERKRVQQASTH